MFSLRPVAGALLDSEAAIAAAMALHPRLGAASSFGACLRVLEADVAQAIILEGATACV